MNTITFLPLQKQGVITQDVEGETLILNNQGEEIHQLNEVASLVWKYCDGSHSVTDISQILLDSYSVSHEQAEKDVTELILQFKAKKLLSEAD